MTPAEKRVVEEAKAFIASHREFTNVAALADAVYALQDQDYPDTRVEVCGCDESIALRMQLENMGKKPCV